MTGGAFVITLFAPWLEPDGFLLGADADGRDMLAQIIWGLHLDVTLGGEILVAIYAVGLAYSWVVERTGAFGAWLDEVIASITLALPLFVIILTLIFITRYEVAVLLPFALLSAPGVHALHTRLRRVATEASPRDRHRTRLVMLAVDSLRRLAFVLLIGASLGFIGLWPNPTSLGGLVGPAIAYIPLFPANAIWPIATLIVLLMGVQLLALGLESRLPPALRPVDPVLALLRRG